MSRRANVLRPLSVFQQTSRASKLLALVPPTNAASDLEGESSSDERPENHGSEDFLDYSSSAPSIPSSLQDILSDSSVEGHNTSCDEISNSEPESISVLTPIMRQVLLSTSQVNFDSIPTLSSILSIPSITDSPVHNQSPSTSIIQTRTTRKRVLTHASHNTRKRNPTAKKKRTTNYKWKRGGFHHKAEIVDIDFEFSMPTDASPINYFYKYLSVGIIQDIVHNTNLYSVQETGRSINVSEDEIKDFISIFLLMGIVRLPSYLDYWSREYRYPPIADVMSLKRFQAIRRHIHFVDNSCPSDNTDRYYKVRPLVEKIRTNCLATSEEIKYSIDEMTIPYKGKKAGNRRQYNPMKPNKWSFKNFVRAGVSGIVYDFILYAGEDTFHFIDFSEDEKDLTLGAKVVVVLCKTIKTRACVVYYDNYFTTLDLALYLRDSYGIFSLGTIRQNRLKGCQKLLVSDKVLKKKGRGSFIQMVDNENKLVVLKWFDNKIVTLVSTYADAFPVQKIKRYSKEQKRYVDVDCPQIIKHYNSHMGGVDLGDMLIALYRTPYKSRRWYTAIFAQMLDICVNNAWLVYRKTCRSLGVNHIPLKSFRSQIARELQHKGRANTKTVSCKTDDSVRYDGVGHWPTFGETYGRCKHCIRNKTDVCCTKCNQRLCLVRKRNCFYAYHNK